MGNVFFRCTIFKNLKKTNSLCNKMEHIFTFWLTICFGIYYLEVVEQFTKMFWAKMHLKKRSRKSVVIGLEIVGKFSENRLIGVKFPVGAWLGA